MNAWIKILPESSKFFLVISQAKYDNVERKSSN